MDLMLADTFTVTTQTVLNDSSRKILVMLYQPIIGCLSVSLYNVFWSELDRSEVMSNSYTHHYITNLLNIDVDSFKVAREKLEAVGLLKVYLKKGSVNDYIYEMYTPIEASDFLNHPILNILLYDKVGKKEYERIISYFEIPIINKDNYKNITLSFNDVFKMVEPTEPNNINAKGNIKGKFNVEAEFEIDFLISIMPKGVIGKQTFNTNTKKLIKNLAFLYSLSALNVKDLLVASIEENGLINEVKFRKACRNYYQFDHDGELPKMIHRREKVMNDNVNVSNYERMIRMFEVLSPYQFLKSKYKGNTPTNRDILLVESLMIDQELNPGVVNVLIDYVLKINNNKLTKNFIETIAGQWKRLGITNVKDAMKVAEEEHHKYKNIKIGKKDSKTPSWFDNEIKEEKITMEEEQELKELLGKYGA